MSLFDLNIENNGVILPSKQSKIVETINSITEGKFAIHSGSHNNYSDLIETWLDDEWEELTNCGKTQDEEAVKRCLDSVMEISKNFLYRGIPEYSEATEDIMKPKLIDILKVEKEKW